MMTPNYPRRMMLCQLALASLALAATDKPAASGDQAGTAAEPVRYVGDEKVDANHDGGLRYAVGAKTWQAFRANRAHPELSDGYGYTYNHAPMLAYWNNRFWIEYLSSPFHEN